jgi:adenylylsulfate kinase-like enzyme
MRPFVLLFTGMSGSGKSSVGNRLKERFEKNWHRDVEHIIFDELRQKLSQGPYGVDPYSPDPNNKRRVYEICGEQILTILKQGKSVIIDTGAGEEANRRLLFQKMRDYPCVLVFFSSKRLLQIYRETLRSILRRDVGRGKFLYAKAYCSLINPLQRKKFPMTGVTKQYEVPKNPDVIVNTSRLSLDESCATIIHYMQEHRFL